MIGLVCDACGEPVNFLPPDLTYAHARSTFCTGIDGLVLGVTVEQWLSFQPSQRSAAVVDSLVRSG